MIDIQLNKKNKKGDRLKELYRYFGFNQKSLAQLVGTQQTAISMAVTGEREVQEVWLYKLKEKYHNINIDWVLTGEGEMLISENKQEYKYLILEDSEPYVPLKDLSRKELERMVVHLWYRVGELEAWRREMEGRVEVGEGKGGKKK